MTDQMLIVFGVMAVAVTLFASGRVRPDGVAILVLLALYLSAQRGRSPWLNDLESVYPNEEIPFWMWSNYFYKEMGPILRWCLVPFLLLLSMSAMVWVGQSLEDAGILHTAIFRVNPGKNFGVPGHLLDWVIWVDTTVISLLLILAIPLYLLARDIRATIRRYGIETREGRKLEKDSA